jgi:hypothetical protein
MARSLARLLAAAFGTAAVFLLPGCFDTSSNVTAGEYPTILTVDPALFRGGLSCGAPGLVHYVATLTDVTASEQFPSTTPVACQSIVSYSEPKVRVGNHYITIGHLYVAAIDGYDRDGIEPESVGSRTMVDIATREVVPPRWTTTCGESSAVVQDAGNGDAELDADPPTRSSPQEDAGADADAPPPYNPLRAPTQVIWKEEVILRGCYPLKDVSGPDASVGDAGSTNDAPIDGETDASVDQEPPDASPPGADAASDTGDGATAEDGAAEG